MALSKITNASVADTAVHGRRNLVINGDMQVDQRGSASTKKTGNEYSVDRTRVAKSGFDQLAYEHGQSTESPDGFSNSLHVKVTTAETALAAEELFYMTHKIEAQNLQHLQYGTSKAKKTTLSFWVRSSLTGTYSVNFYQTDATRSNLQTFSVSTADTWEYKSITIDGDTSGTINNDNGDGLNIHFILAAGSNWHGTPHTGWGAYVATDDFASSSNVDFSAQTGDFYITGIQWEVGDTATPFEHRSYGEELALCQRYFWIAETTNNHSALEFTRYKTSSNNYTCQAMYPVEMRAAPTITASATEIHKPETKYEAATFTAVSGTKQYYQLRYVPASDNVASTIIWPKDGDTRFDAEL